MNPMQPPAPRPMTPNFMRNDNNSMPNTGWRTAYQSPMENMRPSLPGFYISDPNNISARDVPMDGSISFFPANDLSYIIIKQWNGNGMISEAKYILAPPATAQNPQPQEQTAPDEQDQTQDAAKSNSEIVEAITAMLSEQTQRLTAAFSQIGVAFTTLQEKLDSFEAATMSGPGKKMKTKEGPKDENKN